MCVCVWGGGGGGGLLTPFFHLQIKMVWPCRLMPGYIQHHYVFTRDCMFFSWRHEHAQNLVVLHFRLMLLSSCASSLQGGDGKGSPK